MGNTRHLTITRFFAALLVVSFHFGRNVPFLSSGVPHSIVSNGSLAVSYFFCLSGFIMALVYAGPGAGPVNKRKYWIARIARIYPVYIIGLLLMMGFVAWSHLQLTLSVLMLQAWVPGSALSINSPEWSLSVEAAFYLVFPFVAPLLAERFFRWTLVATLVLWTATQILDGYALLHWYGGYPSKSHDLIFYSPLVHLNQFLIGALAGSWMSFKLHPGALLRKQAGFGLLVILTVATVAVFFLPTPGLTVIPAIAGQGWLAFAFVTLIISMTRLPRWMLKVTGSPIAQLLGEASYSLYILQYPLHMIFVKVTGDAAMGPTQAFVLFVVLLVTVSVAMHIVIERPARGLIRKIKFVTGRHSVEV